MQPWKPLAGAARGSTLQRLGIATTVFALSVTACGGASETIAERALEEAAEAGGAGDVDIELDEEGGSVSVEGPEGNTEIEVGSAELPEGWPDDVPLVDGEIVTSSRTSADGEEVWSVNVTTDDAVDTVTGQVEQDLADAGFTIEQQVDQSAGGDSALLVGSRDDLTINVIVLGTPAGTGADTTVSYTISRTGS